MCLFLKNITRVGMDIIKDKLMVRPGVLFWKNGEQYYLFDQISLEQYRINKEAFDILSFCDGKRSVKEIMTSLHADKLAQKAIIVEETDKFILELINKGYIIVENDMHTEFLKYIGSDSGKDNFKLGLVYWEVTNACNHKCVMCYNPTCEVTEDELTLDEGVALIEKFYEMGVTCIIFTGGEPTVRHKELIAWIEACSRFGIQTELFTNGTLITYEMAVELAKVGLGYCRVSIHGAVADTADAISGISGSYERAKEGIKNLVKADIKTAWSVVANKKNFYELREIIEQAITLKCHGVVIGSLDLIGRGALQTELELSPDQEAVLWRFLDESIYVYGEKIRFSWGSDMCKNDAWEYYVTQPELPSREWKYSSKHYMRYVKNSLCGVGQRSCAITAAGNITPCPALYDVVLGNCKSDDIQEIWKNSPELVGFREKLLEDFEHCGRCGMRYACVGGCRANAFHSDGSLYGRDLRRCKVHAKRAAGTLDMSFSFYSVEELQHIDIKPVIKSQYSEWFNSSESEGNGPWIPYIGVVNRIKNKRGNSNE